MTLVDLLHLFGKDFPVCIVILDVDLLYLETVDVLLGFFDLLLQRIHPLFVLLQLHFCILSSRFQIFKHVPMFRDLILEALRLACDQLTDALDLIQVGLVELGDCPLQISLFHL